MSPLMSKATTLRELSDGELDMVAGGCDNTTTGMTVRCNWQGCTTTFDVSCDDSGGGGHPN